MSQVRHAELASRGAQAPMLLGVNANGTVNGRLLVMTLEQKYRNVSDKNTEITYSFPLPFAAVLMEIEVELNGKVRSGEVSAKSIALAQYEEAISEGNSCVMLERNSDASFTMALGNLMAGEDCRIMIRYAQVLQTEHAQVRLMLPTAIAPRYGNPLTQGQLLPHQVPVADITAKYPFNITLTLRGDMANAGVACLSHKTSYLRNKDDTVIQLAQRGYLDRDFILVINNLKNASDALACQDLFDEDQYAAMAIFSPQFATKAPKAIAAKVLVDCSGSMAGDSIEAARRALQGIVSGLAKEDKFSLSRFGTSVEHRSRGMWSGTSQAKASARRWIENLRTNLGGTEMAAALVSTIAIAGRGDCDILLITDGEIEGINEVIQVAKQSTHRVFIVAIGASPAEGHLRRLALETGGHCDFVAPGEDVEPAVVRMSARMRAARATDLRVEWPESLTLLWSQAVQKYAFEDDGLNVCAFFKAPQSEWEDTKVRLWGRLDGVDHEVLMGEADLSVTTSNTNVVARLTAYSKVQELIRDQVAKGEVSSFSEATDLAVAYKLVTDQTNFILVHERTEAEKAQDMPQGHKVPQMLAAGWGGTGLVSSSSIDASPLHVRWRTASRAVSAALGKQASDGGFDSMAAPAVYRTRSRTESASHTSNRAGMDDFEIPAFLRKPAKVIDKLAQRVLRQRTYKFDSTVSLSSGANSGRSSRSPDDLSDDGVTPADLVQWLSNNYVSMWPATYAELGASDIGLSICEWLEFEIGADHEEAQVVLVFLSVMLELGLAGLAGMKSAALRLSRVRSPGDVPPVEEMLSKRIRDDLAGMTAKAWPRAVKDFPEAV